MKPSEFIIECKVEDWHINANVMDRTIKEILTRVTLNRSYNVPYLAGYSKDGKTIYIDKDMPKFFKDSKGKKIKTDKYLILHEAIEKSLIDTLGLLYQHAHQIAYRAEQDAVENDKISWKDYNDFMMQWVKEVSDDTTDIPPDLDLTPYEDEHDQKLLKKMIAGNS